MIGCPGDSTLPDDRGGHRSRHDRQHGRTGRHCDCVIGNAAGDVKHFNSIMAAVLVVLALLVAMMMARGFGMDMVAGYSREKRDDICAVRILTAMDVEAEHPRQIHYGDGCGQKSVNM